MGAGIPKTIGRYTVERALGSGAMGHVYLGRDPELGRAVAITPVRDVGLGEDARTTFLERFRNEARAAARLYHPFIVQVYDVGEDPASGPYLVFEYVAGSTLKRVLAARGPLPPDEVVRLAAQIADALTAAHAHGIIHRDIKPDNPYTSRHVTTVWQGDDQRVRELGKQDAAYMTVVPVWARYMYAVGRDFPNPEIPWEVPPGVNPRDRGDHSRGRKGPQMDLIYRHAEKPHDEAAPADDTAAPPPPA